MIMVKKNIVNLLSCPVSATLCICLRIPCFNLSEKKRINGEYK